MDCVANSSASKVVRVSKERLFKAKTETGIDAEFISEVTFWCEYDDHFAVLSNERSIVGVQYKYGSKNNIILKEDILNDNPDYGPQVFAILNLHNVYTILADESTGSLLAGDSIGNLVQYDLEDGYELKYYIFLGIGSITSVKHLGKIAVFGGQYNCTFIDMERRECLTQKSLRTAVEGIYSVELITLVNRFKENKVYLTVCGGKPDYSQKKTDIFDVTDVFELREPQFAGMNHTVKSKALDNGEEPARCPNCNAIKTKGGLTRVAADGELATGGAAEKLRIIQNQRGEPKQHRRPQRRTRVHEEETGELEARQRETQTRSQRPAQRQQEPAKRNALFHKENV